MCQHCLCYVFVWLARPVTHPCVFHMLFCVFHMPFCVFLMLFCSKHWMRLTGRTCLLSSLDIIITLRYILHDAEIVDKENEWSHWPLCVCVCVCGACGQMITNQCLSNLLNSQVCCQFHWPRFSLKVTGGTRKSKIGGITCFCEIVDRSGEKCDVLRECVNMINLVSIVFYSQKKFLVLSMIWYSVTVGVMQTSVIRFLFT